MFNRFVYLPLSLNSENARKLYSLSRVQSVSLNCIVEQIIEEYLNTQDIPDMLSFFTRNKVNQFGVRLRIGKNIAYLRGINYLSQKKLGELASLDQRSISLIEVGKRKIDIVEAQAIAFVLGVEIKDFLS
jgi:DNA-binding XRE family transcriptional regulator